MKRTTVSQDFDADAAAQNDGSPSPANSVASVRHAMRNGQRPLPPFSRTSSWKTSATACGLSLFHFQKCFVSTSCDTESFWLISHASLMKPFNS